MNEPILGLDGKPLSLSEPIRARFVPQEDLTAFELAILLPFYLGLKPLMESDWAALGNTTRHLQRIAVPEFGGGASKVIS